MPGWWIETWFYFAFSLFFTTFFHILWTVCRFISSFAFAVNWSEWCLSAAWVVLQHMWAAQWHKVSKKLFKLISFLWKILQQGFSYTVSAHMCTHGHTLCSPKLCHVLPFLPGALVSLCQSSDCQPCWRSLKKEGCDHILLSLLIQAVTHEQTCTSIGRARNVKLIPPSWVRPAICALGKCRWASGSRGGEEGWGKMSLQPAAAHAWIPLISPAHTLSPCCCCLPNTQTSRIQCLRVWVYAAVMVVVDRGNMGSVPSRHTKNYLFNTVREHLTLNLCETSPDRSTTENSGTETKSSAQRKEGASVGPCWPALRRAVGLTEIWKVFLPLMTVLPGNAVSHTAMWGR